MTIYINTGGSFAVIGNHNGQIVNRLPPQTYSVDYNPMRGFSLTAEKDLKVPDIIYGDADITAKRTLTAFERRDKSTGALLIGEKGSGKTMTAMLIALEAQKKGIPVILVNKDMTVECGMGLGNFIGSIDQEIVVIFDEFDKTHPSESQDRLLTMFDGVSSSKKLFVVTANSEYRLSDFLVNRPGRFLYLIDHNGVDEKFIRSFCVDKIDEGKINEIVNLSSEFERFNFDMLDSLVTELVCHPDDTVKDALFFLNISPNRVNRIYYSISCKNNEGEKVDIYPKEIDNVHAPRGIEFYYDEQSTRVFFADAKKIDADTYEIVKDEHTFRFSRQRQRSRAF